MKNEKIKPPLSHKSKRFDKLDFSTKKISTFQAIDNKYYISNPTI